MNKGKVTNGRTGTTTTKKDGTNFWPRITSFRRSRNNANNLISRALTEQDVSAITKNVKVGAKFFIKLARLKDKDGVEFEAFDLTLAPPSEQQQQQQDVSLD